MTDKVFLDTAVFIYFLENNPYFADKVEEFLNDVIRDKKQLFTSTVTIMEFCTKPYELGNINLVNDFNNFLSELNITLITINNEIAQKAAELRGKYKSIKGMDALQLASAINGGCNKFISNDSKLSKVSEISVELVKNF